VLPLASMESRKTAEKVLVTVIQEVWIGGIDPVRRGIGAGDGPLRHLEELAGRVGVNGSKLI
jgi:hypothetical protein